jgi:hypothetical protein
MVGLALAPLKVPRRAVRILVLTVRSATARRRATPLGCRRARPLPARSWGGEVSVLDRSGVGFPIRHSLAGNGSGRLDTSHRLVRWFYRGGHAAAWTGSSTGAGSERLARLPSLAAAHSRCFAREPHRRAGTVTAPTWFLSGGRRKPPWSRTELGEWSPRDEKGLYNRPGRENL